MPKYRINWCKTYYATGEVDIVADSEQEAIEYGYDTIGDWEGHMEYFPEDDQIDVQEIVDTTT